MMIGDDRRIQITFPRGETFIFAGSFFVDGVQTIFLDRPARIVVDGLIVNTYFRFEYNPAQNSFAPAPGDSERVRDAIFRALEEERGGSVGRIAWK